MKKMFKILSLMLAMALLISSFSTVVFATEGEETASDAVKFFIEAEDAKAVVSGVVSDFGDGSTLTEKSGNVKRILFRLDCTPFLGKTVSKITLNFWAKRNDCGASTTFTVHKLNDNVWTADDVTLTGTYYATAAATQAYTFADYTTNEAVTIDITSIFSGVTAQKPYLNLVLRAKDCYSDYGPKVAGLNESGYAPYFEVEGIEGDSTLHFNGGHGTEGTMETVSGVAGTTVTVPECSFTKTGYSFVKWADSEGNFYYPQGTYAFKNLNDTLRAVWSYDASSSTDFVIKSEDAKIVVGDEPQDFSSGTLLNEKSGKEKRILFRLDCTPFLGKTVSKITLKFWANRNYAGNPTFAVNKLNNDIWDGDTFGTLSGTYWATGTVVEKAYSNAAGAANYIDNTGSYLIDLDVTTIFNNANLTVNNPYLSLVIRSKVYSDTSGTKVFGLTDLGKEPYFEVETRESVYFVKVDELGGEEVVTTMETAEACDEIVAKTTLQADSMIPLAAVYNTADNTLVKCIIGSSDSDSLALSSNLYSGGDKYVRFFVFNNMTGIVPLIPATDLR